LAKEGTTWQGVVDNAVNGLCWKPAPPLIPAKAEEPLSVEVLVNEAKELARSLDELNAKFEGGDTAGDPSPPV
jgi:hypothetical protein